MIAGARPPEEKVNSAPANTSDTIACMSQAPYGPGPAAPSGWPPQGPPSSSRGPSRLPTIIAIVIALIAVAVAIAAWFRPAPKAETPAAKTYSEQEIADAKKAVCDAFGQTERALNTNSQKAGAGPTDDRAVVANTRIAINAAGTYLALTISGQPATPPDLANSIRKLANQYQSMVLDQIGDADSSRLNSDYQAADTLVSGIAKDCA